MTSALLQARLADERTQRIQAEHDAAEEARHAARLAAQRESSQGVQIALARQVRPMRMRVHTSLCWKRSELVCTHDVCVVGDITECAGGRAP